MQASQLPQVVDIEGRAHAFPWSEGNFRDSLNAGYSAWVLLDANQRVLGYTVVSMAVGEAQLLNISVDPALQRRGYGRLLMDKLLEQARLGAMDCVLLEVRVSNEPARRLYEAYGFRQIGLRKKYYRAANGGSEDALVMLLELTGEGSA